MMKYAINVEKKQITAYVEGCENDAVNRANRLIRIFLKNGGVSSVISYSNKKMKMAKKYSGTVTLRGDDVWNVEEGKKLAREKCLNNYHRAMELRMGMFAKDIKNFFNAIK